MADTSNTTRKPGEDAENHRISLAELNLEREKNQIERERLALERERWASEREKFQENRRLTDRAAGRLTMGLGSFTLAMLCAVLTGGALGAWLVTKNQSGNQPLTASLIHTLGSGTNDLSDAESSQTLLQRLGRPGRGGGYLLILD